MNIHELKHVKVTWEFSRISASELKYLRSFCICRL